MARLQRPLGLIRYTSQEELDTGRRRLLRPRLVIYTAILVIMFGGLVYSLQGKASADVTLLRGLGSPFTVLPSGEVSNQIRLKITNRSDQQRSYAFELVDGDGLTMVAPENPLVVAAGDTQMTAAFITASPAAFTDGELAMILRVSDGVELTVELPYRLLGPTG
jgi:polyferredoxin